MSKKNPPEIAGAAPFLGISLPSALANTMLFCSQAQLLIDIPRHFDLYSLRHILSKEGCPVHPCPLFESHKTLLFSFLYVLNVFVSNVFFYEKRSNYFVESDDFPSMRIVGGGLWGIEEFLDLFTYHTHNTPKYKPPFNTLLHCFKKGLIQKKLSSKKVEHFYLKLRGYVSCGDPLLPTGINPLRRALPRIQRITVIVAQGSGNCIFLPGMSHCATSCVLPPFIY